MRKRMVWAVYQDSFSGIELVQRCLTKEVADMICAEGYGRYIQTEIINDPFEEEKAE